ncbi:MAG: stimulus-sensing domain-containing protein [Alphaproteobacteria bacterium]
MTEGRDRTPDDKGQAALRRPLASVIRHPPSVSPLTWRIMAVNMLALAILGGSMVLSRRLSGAPDSGGSRGAVARSADDRQRFGRRRGHRRREERDILSPDLARSMVRRLVESSDSRMRLFDAEGELIADSRMLAVTREAIQIEDVPPPDGWRIGMFWQILTDFVAEKIPRQFTRPMRSRPNSAPSITPSPPRRCKEPWRPPSGACRRAICCWPPPCRAWL